MGIATLVLAIVGICICWLPLIGWGGVAMGIVACGIGIPSVTHWYEKPGFTGWGIAGSGLGGTAVSIGFAYQIKHSAGELDFLYTPLATPLAFGVLGLAGTGFALGLVVARKASRPLGVAIAALSIAVLVVSAGWALTTADRALLAQTE